MFCARVVAEKERERRARKVVHIASCVHRSHTRVHTRRKQRGERISGEPRFSEEIFPGSHFPGGLARSDSSLVFRRDFIAEKSAFERGRLQVATAKSSHPVRWYPTFMCTCVACACVRACTKVPRDTSSLFFYIFFLFRPAKEKRIRVASEYRAATIRREESRTAKKSKFAITRYILAFGTETAIEGGGGKRETGAELSCGFSAICR